jgi:glycosyltransferase involved in cell wall biosynthesis
LSRNKHERIINIPNGVSPEIVHYDFKGEEIPNSIGFWGALDTLPNSTAVHFFYNEIFSKYLRHKGISWYIIGKNPDDKMIELGKRHKNIIITGFVDDLYSLVSRIPIMINPMQTGGGIKNKVLEAFALERLVISNEMGMEAINAKRGVHYIYAEEPKEFAEEIMKYAKSVHARLGIGHEARRFVLENFTWEKIGEKYLDLIDRALSG